MKILSIIVTENVRVAPLRKGDDNSVCVVRYRVVEYLYSSLQQEPTKIQDKKPIHHLAWSI